MENIKFCEHFENSHSFVNLRRKKTNNFYENKNKNFEFTYSL